MVKTLEDVSSRIIFRRPHIYVCTIAPSRPVAHRDGSGRGRKPRVRRGIVARCLACSSAEFPIANPNAAQPSLFCYLFFGPAGAPAPGGRKTCGGGGWTHYRSGPDRLLPPSKAAGPIKTHNWRVGDGLIPADLISGPLHGPEFGLFRERSGRSAMVSRVVGEPKPSARPSSNVRTKGVGCGCHGGVSHLRPCRPQASGSISVAPLPRSRTLRPRCHRGLKPGSRRITSGGGFRPPLYDGTSD